MDYSGLLGDCHASYLDIRLAVCLSINTTVHCSWQVGKSLYAVDFHKLCVED